MLEPGLRGGAEANRRFGFVLIGAESGDSHVGWRHATDEPGVLHVVQRANAVGNILRGFALPVGSEHVLVIVPVADVERGLFGSEQTLVHLVAGGFAHAGGADESAHAQGEGQAQQQGA